MPSRKISTLELLATALGLVLLSPPELAEEGLAAAIAVTRFADGQVSAAVVTRGLTTSYPSALWPWNWLRSFRPGPRNFS